MSANPNEPFKMWPKFWYEDENENGYPRCPVCGVVFRTTAEVHNLPDHMSVRTMNLNINFYHDILLAIFEIRECPYCEYVQSDFFNISFKVFSTRDLFLHERTAHGSQNLSNPKKSIGLIRDLRRQFFGGVPEEIWPKLLDYYKRNIRRQAEYTDIMYYLEKYYDMFRPKDQDWQLIHILGAAKRSDLDEWSEEDWENWEKHKEYYPVKRNEFLVDFTKLQDPVAYSGHVLATYKAMKRHYDEGDF
ncbi:hypothetical protein JMJ35_008346 [Cladonia borealis]|uniref:Uncharacterized protein n=1 Tax=Cladonia borealis TaxID=184061 RepID=A0AA39QTN9_9LECA|nr:hypothetical protein JMJ35_008346 [Cladonia borealis]